MSESDSPREPCGLTYSELGDLSDDRVMAHLAAGHGDAVAVLRRCDAGSFPRLVQNGGAIRRFQG